ncbi:hypothetical protein [Amycolatopsis sp. NPDC004625]|uniref:hypothetical protein n=1 Tax=Amycolatopsis sp. NPDC004625 TaxID=3154670 RepID=UPI0033A6F2BB
MNQINDAPPPPGPASRDPEWPMPRKPVPPPVVTVRQAVVLLLALVCGLTVGVLTYLAGGNLPAAILAGLSSFGGAVVFLHRAVDREDR